MLKLCITVFWGIHLSKCIFLDATFFFLHIYLFFKFSLVVISMCYFYKSGKKIKQCYFKTHLFCAHSSCSDLSVCSYNRFYLFICFFCLLFFWIVITSFLKLFWSALLSFFISYWNNTLLVWSQTCWGK